MNSLKQAINESFVNESSSYVKYGKAIDLKKYKKLTQQDFDRLNFYDIITICEKDTNIVQSMKIVHDSGYVCNYLTNEFDMSVKGIDNDTLIDFYVLAKNAKLYSNGKGQNVEIQKVIDKLKDKLSKYFYSTFKQTVVFADKPHDGLRGSYNDHFNIHYTIDGFVGLIGIKTDFSGVKIKITSKMDWTGGTGHLAGNRKTPKSLENPEEFKQTLESAAAKFLAQVL